MPTVPRGVTIRIRSWLPRTTRRLGAVLILFFLVTPALAHLWSFTAARTRFPDPQHVEVDFFFDLNALMAGADPGHLGPEDLQALLAMRAGERQERVEALREFLHRSLHISFDGREIDIQVRFPALEQAARDGTMPSLLPGQMARLQGEIPAAARTFAFQASPLFGPIVLAIRTGEKTDRLVLAPGQESEPYPLDSQLQQSTWAVGSRYLRLGFEHILPRGLDHILFVLGLYLLSTRLRSLLLQVTAFTVAHSVSLALSIYGVVSLPPEIVEPLIALSIAYVALENIFTSELKPWRPAVVFGFGLLHGLGFAGVLQELGLPREQFVTALVTFNAGVELGQIAIITLAFAVAGWFRSRVWYRALVVVPASLAIAAVGLYWALERSPFV